MDETFTPALMRVFKMELHTIARIHPVPLEIDRMVSATKLQTMGISIDELTEEQEEYLSAWEMGT